MDDAAEAACTRGETAFREERWFAAHEHWEEAWRLLPAGHERLRVHGLLHLAVALYQHERDNLKGAQSQLEKARHKLRHAPDLADRVALVARTIGAADAR